MNRIIVLLSSLMMSLPAFAEFQLVDLPIEPILANSGEISDETLEAELEQFEGIADAISYREKVETQELKIKSLQFVFDKAEALMLSGAVTETKYLQAKSKLAVARAQLRQYRAMREKANQEAFLAKLTIQHKGQKNVDKRLEMTRAMKAIYEARIEHTKGEIEKVKAHLVYDDRMKNNAKKLIGKGVISPVDHNLRLSRSKVRHQRVKNLEKVIRSLEFAKAYLQKNIDTLADQEGSI